MLEVHEEESPGEPMSKQIKREEIKLARCMVCEQLLTTNTPLSF